MNAMRDEFGEEHAAGETLPFSALNKRRKEVPIDLMSELPDDLLIHILSFVGVKQAAVTSVLSKRWEFLWAELPRLDFWEIEKPIDFVSWVNRTLHVRKGDYLEKFMVRFINCDESDVDAWVEFSEVPLIMAKNGPQLKIQHLTLTCLKEYAHTVSAIICLLESSPNLETLLLQAHKKKKGGIAELAPAPKKDLDGDLLHLKKIRIKNFADSNGEPMLTLAQFLLARAPVLEDMVIEVEEASLMFELKLLKMLVRYPRSSPKAKVYFLSQ